MRALKSIMMIVATVLVIGKPTMGQNLRTEDTPQVKGVFELDKEALSTISKISIINPDKTVYEYGPVVLIQEADKVSCCGGILFDVCRTCNWGQGCRPGPIQPECA